MEIAKIIDSLAAFELRRLATRDEPTYIETHKMIKPRQTSFFPACLYVGYSSELPTSFPEEGTANLICIDDAPVPEDFLRGGGVNLYLAPAGTNQFDVLNRIADIMIDEAAVVAGMRRILDVLYKGEGLQSLVDIAAEVLGNAVFVNDPAFKILAMSQGFTFENATLELEKTIGYVHMDNVEAMRRDGVFAQRTLGGVSRLHRTDPDETWLIKNIALHGVPVATVAAVDNSQPFRTYHEELLDRFSNIIAVELEKSEFYRDDQSVMHGYFLGDLLSKKILSEKAIEQRCRIIRWKTLAWFKVLVIADAGKGLAPARVRQLTHQLQAVIPQAKWTVLQDNIVLLVTSAERSVLRKGELSGLEVFLRDNDLHCGVSRSFSDLVDTRRYYTQAYRAIDTGLQLTEISSRVFMYEAMMPYCVLQFALRRSDLLDVRPESMAIIESYDERNSGELLKTLEAYLMHAGDPVVAARELSIHRNTLLYRINKVKELTGIDLHDGDTRLSIQLYLKALRFRWAGPTLRPME